MSRARQTTPQVVLPHGDRQSKRGARNAMRTPRCHTGYVPDSRYARIPKNTPTTPNAMVPKIKTVGETFFPNSQ